MAVAMILEVPGFTAETYGSVMEHLDWYERDLPEGFVSHYACATDGGWYVFDVWESREDFERFLHERLGPALAAATGGSPPSVEPRFLEIHNEDHARSRV
jgi:heme-degrading monooxygenase HmoA